MQGEKCSKSLQNGDSPGSICSCWKMLLLLILSSFAVDTSLWPSSMTSDFKGAAGSTSCCQEQHPICIFQARKTHQASPFTKNRNIYFKLLKSVGFKLFLNFELRHLLLRLFSNCIH